MITLRTYLNQSLLHLFIRLHKRNLQKRLFRVINQQQANQEVEAEVLRVIKAPLSNKEVDLKVELRMAKAEDH